MISGRLFERLLMGQRIPVPFHRFQTTFFSMSTQLASKLKINVNLGFSWILLRLCVMPDLFCSGGCGPLTCIFIFQASVQKEN